MITVNVAHVNTQVRKWKFPDTTVGIDIQVGSQKVDFLTGLVQITCIFGGDGINGEKFSINDDLIALANVVDAVERRYPNAGLELILPYLPYSRQDRAVNAGEANSLKVIGKMINGMGFRTVFTYDVHSTVADCAIDNLFVFDQFAVFSGVRQSFRETYIVAPDQGATKKCEDFAKRVGAAGVITCVKNRDLQTGKITGLRVIDYVPANADLLVLDDIADAGGTFIYLAQELRKHEPARLDLAVTHGLFTKGVGIVKDHFDKIFTTDSYISDKNGAIVIKL